MLMTGLAVVRAGPMDKWELAAAVAAGGDCCMDRVGNGHAPTALTDAARSIMHTAVAVILERAIGGISLFPEG